MYVPFYKSKDFQPNSHSPMPLIHSYVLNTYRRSSRAKTNHRYSGSATIGKLGTTDRYASPIGRYDFGRFVPWTIRFWTM